MKVVPIKDAKVATDGTALRTISLKKGESIELNESLAEWLIKTGYAEAFCKKKEDLKEEVVNKTTRKKRSIKKEEEE